MQVMFLKLSKFFCNLNGEDDESAYWYVCFVKCSCRCAALSNSEERHVEISFLNVIYIYIYIYIYTYISRIHISMYALCIYSGFGVGSFFGFIEIVRFLWLAEVHKWRGKESFTLCSRNWSQSYWNVAKLLLVLDLASIVILKKKKEKSLVVWRQYKVFLFLGIYIIKKKEKKEISVASFLVSMLLCWLIKEKKKLAFCFVMVE